MHVNLSFLHDPAFTCLYRLVNQRLVSQGKKSQPFSITL